MAFLFDWELCMSGPAPQWCGTSLGWMERMRRRISTRRPAILILWADVLLHRALNPVEEGKTMFSIPGLKVISLTDAAAERIRQIMSQAGADMPALGLRVGVKKGGCAGMEYTFEIAREIEKGDEVVTEKDATVIVDAKAVLFLLGTELDFRTDRFSATFVFNNPNQVSACGCGESVEIKPRSEGALSAS